MSDMAQFMYTLKVTRLEQLTEGPTAEEQAIVARHFAYLQDLTEKGVAILVGRTSFRQRQKRKPRRLWPMTQPSRMG